MFTKNDVLEILENECYDILNDYEPEKVADLVLDILRKIGDKISESNPRLIIGETYEVELDDFKFEIRNVKKGYVRCTNTVDENIGLSKTLFYPYYYDSDDRLAGLTNLVEMINEAYYNCISA